MNPQQGLAERFETCRAHLHAVAYRMLGSVSEADDAVQETWLRLARADTSGVRNLAAWLTTVVSRVCLDMLRSRGARQEEPADHDASPDPAAAGSPERETVLADSVGRALLVVLRRLHPAERVAFVLHDMFAVPFEEIAPVVGRSVVATKKLASRARHTVRGSPVVSMTELARHRQVVDAFLAASRAGDLDAVLAVLAPDVMRRADRVALSPGRATEIRGATAAAEEIVVFGRNARFADPALINGAVGILVAPGGRLQLALTVTIKKGRIAEYELIAEPARLHQLDVAVLGG